MTDSRKMESEQLRGAFSGEGKQTTADKQDKDNLTTMRVYDKPMPTLQQNFEEEAFNKIKTATDITDAEELLVRKFIKNEERNFSLFNYVNELNNEIERYAYDEQIQQLREEELKFAKENGTHDVNQHKEILRDLESKLQTSESMAEKYEQRCQDPQRITERLKHGMQSIFPKFDFAEEEGAPPLVVTEVNMVHNLELIEQKANQLPQHYSQVRGLLQGPPSTKASTQGRTPFSGNRNDRDRAAVAEEDGFDELQDMSQNLVSVLGTGPKVPFDQELLYVYPPKSANYRSVEFDNEDDGDTRPLTRDELKSCTLNKPQKRLGGMAMLSLTGGANSSTLNTTSRSVLLTRAKSLSGIAAASVDSPSGKTGTLRGSLSRGALGSTKDLDDSAERPIEIDFHEHAQNFESLKRGMQSIFSKFDFAEEEGAPPPVVTEVNMVHNLGLIELKANQLLEHYSQVRGLLQGPPSTKASTQGRTPFSGGRNDRDRAATAAVEEEDGFDKLQDMSQNLVSVLGTGPKVHFSQELLHVYPPKPAHCRSDESDNEDDGDTRPLTRDELKHRTLGLGGMAMLSLTGGGATGITNSSTLNNTSSSSATNAGATSGGGDLKESPFMGVTFWMICRFIVSTFFNVIACDLISPEKPQCCRCFRANWKAGLFGLLLVITKVANGATATLPQSEYLALYDLYNSTNGADWRWSHLPQAGIPWVFSADANPCADKWQGVDCIIVNAPPLHTYHVSSLTLAAMKLRGPLPNTLDDLPHVDFLDLDNNKLFGSIPSSIGNLTNLHGLYLNNNQLTGSIPRSIGSLTNLQQLYLYSNKLNGSIPNSIGMLTNLQDLILYYNQLTGSIPSSLGCLTNLRFMYLHNNQLTGSIPNSIGNLTNLQYLNLYVNKLTGSIPSSIGNFTNLQLLYLNINQLTGTIPSSIGNLTVLINLFFDSNLLTGSIPSSIGTLCNLLYLSLPNNYITGSIPSSLANFTNLQYLDLRDNRLTGQLDPLGHMYGLVSLSLKGNWFSGPLAVGFSSAQTHLQSVQLDDNQFTGTLPAVLFDLPSLVSFSMVGSCLHGTLPGNICNATRLEALILYGLTTGASCRARGVQLQSRQSFSGTMPSCLLQLPKLDTLLLSSNGLTGSIGSDIVVGVRLLQLDLSHNDLTGPIPNCLQNRSWSLLDLSHNKLSGTLHGDLLIPFKASSLSNFSAYESLLVNYSVNPTVSLTSNRLSGPVPNSLRPLQSNLSVLAGNLFECKYDKSNLPQHDRDISNYQCASNDFNAAVFAWLSLCVGVTVLLLVVYRHNLSLLLNTALIQLSDEHSARLTHLHSLLEEYHVLCKAAWYCAAFCLVVLLPYYAIVSHYEGTHTYQYAYVLSAIYTSGVLPFVLDVLLLGLLIALVNARLILKKQVTSSTINAKGSVRERLRYASVVIIYSLANITIVLGANVAFVYVVLYQSSQVQTLAQVVLSLFKLAWSVSASPYLIRLLDMYFYPEENGSAQSYFELQLVVSLFNNIAIPCLVVAAIDPNCFSNILLPPDSQTVTYLLPTCGNKLFAVKTCVQTTPELATLQFTPPFTYSYLCSASFITSYAPTFIYMSISTVFLSPLLQCVLLRLHERLPAGSIAHCMVSKLLPRILKPDVSPSLDHYRRTPLLGAVGTLVTLLTQLGILLTFGAIFPPVALAMAVSITAVVVATRYKVQLFVHAVVEKQLFAYLDIINAECERVGTREQMQVAVKILICYCCAFYTLFLFDTLGDAVGFDASVWVLVVFPLLPFAVYGTESLWWKGYKVVIKEVQMNEVNNETSLELGATVDIDIELSAARSGEAGMNVNGGPNRTAADLRKGGSESENNCDNDHTVNILHANDV